MRNFVFLVLFLILPLGLLFVVNKPSLMMRTTEQWDWICIACAVLASALFVRYYEPEIERARNGSDKPDFSTVLLLFILGCPFNYLTMISVEALLLTGEATETVEVLEDTRKEMPVFSKGSKERTKTCEHYVVFRFANGRIESTCADRTYREALTAPGKATLHLQTGWPGRAYVRLSPLPAKSE